MKSKYTIAELEAKIAATDNKYAVRSLKEQLSWLKAEEAGQYVTVEHLKELRSLIIWKANQVMYRPGANTLRAIMEELLQEVNKNEIVFRTEKGIKGVVLGRLVAIAQEVALKELIEREGEEVLTDDRSRLAGSDYYRMQQHFLRVATN